MAALFPKIYDVIDTNPNKYATLRWCEPTSTQGSNEETWEQFQLKPLTPPGALSILLTISDPMYELGSIPLRRQLQTEHLLVLHQRVDREIVGRRFPRKKIQDLLAAEVSAQNPTGSPLLEEVLCELFGVQKVHLHRRNKTIRFYPPDIRVWKSDKPIVFAEEDNTWIFTPDHDIRLQEWLLEKEEEGWTVSWPTADGKMEDLKAAFQGSAGTAKLKKDDLAKAVGRSQAIRTLQELAISIHPVKLETP